MASTSDLRRMIQQGGVKIDGEVENDFKRELGAGEYVVQVGKRKFAKAKVAE